MKSNESIEIWDMHDPVDVKDFVININEPKQKIPESIENDVEELWNEHKKKDKLAKDNKTVFLDSYYRDDRITANVEPREFKYNYVFNYHPNFFYSHQNLGDKLNLNSLSALTVVFNGSKAIFGSKKNIGNQISVFGGFIIQDDFKDRKVDVFNYVKRTSEKELPFISGVNYKIEKTGLSFCPTLRKGFGVDYLVTLDLSNKDLDDVVKQFKENEQFKKELFVVEFPGNIKNFLKNNHSHISKYAISSILNALSSLDKKKGEELFQYMKDKVNIKKLNPFINGKIYDILKNRTYGG